MNTKILTIFLIGICLISSQCSTSKKVGKYNNKILGYWERVGDNRAGLIVKVDQLKDDDVYLGKIVKPVSLFEINDLIWQNVQGVNTTQWQGDCLVKRNTMFSGVQSSTIEGKFLLVNDNLLEVYTKDGTQKWIKTDKKKAMVNFD